MMANLLIEALKSGQVGVNLRQPADKGTIAQARDQLRSVRDNLPTVQKFDFGAMSSTTIANDGWKGLRLFGERRVHLPFDECYFEHRWHDDGVEITSGYVAIQGEAIPKGMDLVAMEFRCVPAHALKGRRLPNKHRRLWMWTGLVVGVGFRADCADLHYLADHAGFARIGEEELERQATSLLSPVCLMATLLTMPSCSTQARRPQQINDRRRDGNNKSPLHSHHVVTIKPASYQELTGVIDDLIASSPRSSPRLHLRRGHLRHLPSGREVWVRPCAVGNREFGTVSHDYRCLPADQSVA